MHELDEVAEKDLESFRRNPKAVKEKTFHDTEYLLTAPTYRNSQDEQS